MSINSEEQWLFSKIKDLPFRSDLKDFASEHQLKTLGEVINVRVADLMKLKGFNYHLLQELTQFLEERNLAHLLKQ